MLSNSSVAQLAIRYVEMQTDNYSVADGGARKSIRRMTPIDGKGVKRLFC